MRFGPKGGASPRFLRALEIAREKPGGAKRATKAKDCPDCGQPMLPAGEVKRPNEYDHASGCPRSAAKTKKASGWTCDHSPVCLSRTEHATKCTAGGRVGRDCTTHGLPLYPDGLCNEGRRS